MLWLFTVGCTMGPSAETLIDELRVVAILAEPPEASPGEVVALTTVTADPESAGYDTLSWTCTFTGEDCLEASGFEGGAWDGAAVFSDPDGPTDTVYAVPPQFSEFVTDEPVPLVQVWSLSCLPGLCPQIDAVGSASDTDQIREWLSSPTAFMEDLPMEGVSLGFRTLSLSTRAAEERAQNPVVSCAPDDGGTEFEAEAEVAWTCTAPGASDVWGYATGGGWEGASRSVDESGEATYTWFAPEEAGTVTLWMVALDGAGGVGLWTEEVAVVAL